MISRIVTKNGNKVFEIDGKEFLPAAFSSFRPTPANVSLFYRNGMRLFKMRITGLTNTWNMTYSNYGPAWIGNHTYDFSVLDNQMEMFMKFAPEGYFMIMVQLDMPEWWRNENQCQCNSYSQIGEAALEEKWITDACDYFQALIQYAEGKYGDRVFAYGFAAGSSNEWFDQGHLTISERKAADYRLKIGDLDATIPTREQLCDKTLPSLRGDDDPVYRYQKYCADSTPNLILRFAHAAQQVLNHQKLVGLFFGYATLPFHWQNRTCTNGYEKVWACEDIDMLFAPAAYTCRRSEDAASYQYTVDSVEANNKLYLHEIDHHTYLSKYPSENFKIMDCIYDDEESTIIALRKEMCAAAVKGSSLYWFDMQGGWYASPGLEREIQHEIDILNELYKIPHHSVSEIAVFIDPMSYLRMKDENDMTFECGQYNRNNLHHCGAPFDFFNLRDITKIDLSHYKMCVFLNAIEMSEEVKVILKEKMQDITKVWMYAPNWATGGIAEVCSIHLREIDSTEAKVKYGEQIFGFSDPTSPLYAIDDKDAEILAYYTNGAPACARKNKDIYIAVGNVPSDMWRDLARAAGVHIYVDTPGAFYADSRFVARHTVWENNITIHMPFDCITEELFDGGIYRTENRELKYKTENGEVKLFMIREVIHDIESIGENLTKK